LLSASPAQAANKVKALEIPWKNLSDQQMSSLGKKVLTVQSDLWRHAESNHFVYHYTDRKKAEMMFFHSEFFYDWIKKRLGVKKDKWASKGHVFIFSDAGMWQTVQSHTGLHGQGVTFSDGREIFMYRQANALAPRQIIAHEMTHIILFRFLGANVPLFLNEGFAEYSSYKGLARQLGKSEYAIRSYIPKVPKEAYISLKELSSMQSYPTSEKKRRLFYQESEWLVRFLIQENKSGDLYPLLKQMVTGQSFEKALQKVYGLKMSKFEDAFVAYAVKK